MGSTYLARIASLYCGIAVKGAAEPAGEKAAADQDQRSLRDQRERPGNFPRNARDRSTSYVSQRHSPSRKHGSPAREIQLNPIMLRDEWSELSRFKAELEALRLRMIDACLNEEECAVEPLQAIAIDFVPNGNPTPQHMNRGSLTRAVQDEVASAVRLLASAGNGGRQK